MQIKTEVVFPDSIELGLQLGNLTGLISVSSKYCYITKPNCVLCERAYMARGTFK